MELTDLENALILVGKNSTGKTAVLDAIRAVGGDYQITEADFRDGYPSVNIHIQLEITEEDLHIFHSQGRISRYRKYELWLQDFYKKLPSYKDGILSFNYIAKWNGARTYSDGVKKNNPYIQEVFPQIFYLDAQRNLEQFQNDLLYWIEDDMLKRMRADVCIFDKLKSCKQCFECIGLIEQKSVKDLNAFETSKLLDYKLYHLNLDEFSKAMNRNYHRNGGREELAFSMHRDLDQMLSMKAESYMPGIEHRQPVSKLGKGMRSVYLLSLLETYAEGEARYPGIMVVEEPEIFLHPQMQKVAGEILYRLSKKNQVMFTTHSANLLSNFNNRQIKQIMLDDEGTSFALKKTNISRILDDLGYSAGDLMNVDFVFIVEGKQDKSRLPLLIEKYYSELSRISIISTNSCTNIKTYANLKYINQLQLKEQLLIIRDSDGKDRQELQNQLCKYYEERSREETIDTLPRIRPRNILILKYYSFENYFLNPKVMVQIGVIDSEEAFYETLLQKWKSGLYRLRSASQLKRVIGTDLRTVEDIKKYMEEIKIYLRGHNIYDIFYGRFKKNEEEILKKYIELAPREEFADILDSIDSFIYFENRRKEE